MLKLFLNFESRKAGKYFRTRKLAKSITGFLFILVFLFVFAGIYQFFVSGFSYINSNLEQDVRLPVTLFIYEIFLLVLAGIIVLSCIISSIFNLFRGENDNWIISSPAYKMLPKFVFIKSSSRSVWPFFVVFLPAILAFYEVYNLSVLSLFFIFSSFIVLLILLNALTLSAIIAISSVYYYVSQRIKLLRFSFKGLIAILLLLVVIAVSTVWTASIKNIDLIKLFRADEANSTVNISNISGHFYFLPTHPFALEIVNWQNSHLQDAIVDFFEIFLLASIFVFILWGISGLFYPLWQKLQEGNFHETKATKSSFARKINFRFRGDKIAALFKKEALISIRNPRGTLWFLFIFFIWFAQIGMNVVLSKNIQRYHTDISQKLAMIQALQFIIAIYFICSFTLRFVFPAFSLEKKTAWILASAPINFKRIYFGKHLFYSLFFVAIGIFMSFINVSILNLPFSFAAYSILLFISVVIFIVTLGLSLGAIFPNFETDDPEIIGTSMPGLFFTALSLIYGALGAWILYSTMISGNIFSLLFFITSTFILIAIILKKTPNFAGNRDFS